MASPAQHSTAQTVRHTCMHAPRTACSHVSAPVPQGAHALATPYTLWFSQRSRDKTVDYSDNIKRVATFATVTLLCCAVLC